MTEKNDLLESMALVAIDQGEKLKTIETTLQEIRDLISTQKPKEDNKIEKAFLEYFNKDKKQSKIRKKDFFEHLDTIMITLLGAGDDIEDSFKTSLYEELYNRI